MATTAAAAPRPATLRSFLEARRVTSAQWNITGLAADIGKYHVSDEDYGNFLQLFYEHCHVAARPAHLLERHSPDASPILVDLDFRWPAAGARIYRATAVAQFVTALASALVRFIQWDDDADLRFFVQETPAPRIEKGQHKDGIHIVCPDIALRYEELFALRRYLLEQNIVDSCFPDRLNPATDCLDESVVRRNNWFLYGASKSPERSPYRVSRCFVLSPDGDVSEDTVLPTAQELVCALSIRRTAGASSYSVRPDMAEEWNTWKSLCDKKPATATTTDIIVCSPPTDDAASVASHLSENISKIIHYPGLVWTITEEGAGFKLTHNSKRCLVDTGAEHSTLNHSCVFVNAASANLVCFSHNSRRLPKPIAAALWKLLNGDTEDCSARYSAMKSEFEKNVFRILDPPGYVVNVDGKRVHYTRAQLIDMNSGSFVDSDKKVRFIDQWLRDDSIRTYARMEYYVDPAECPAAVFNTFGGFKATHISADRHGDITPVLQHLRVVANHDDDAYEFILDWMASCIQRPGQLNHICMVVFGQEGSGKDIIFQWFGNEIIGHEAYYNTARPHIDLFGSFNATRENRVFYKIEESNERSFTEENVEQFKNYITDKYASIQHKGKDTSGLRLNYNHFMISSNNKVPFHINLSERRFFAVRSSSEKVRNSAYFSHLAEAVLKDEGVIRSFYDFLMARPIAARDWLNPPQTDALTAWKSECMPVLHPFIEWYSATIVTKPHTVRASEIYARYQDWCAEVEEELLSVRSFGVELRKIPQILKVHSRTGTTYSFV